MAERRRIIQWVVLLVNNSYLKGFFTGRIYRGSLKRFCVPGLNCYSCPGAVASCPLGSLQAILGAYQYRFSFYVAGLLIGLGTFFGRFVCGFLCPFGLIQELLHKIPFYKFTREYPVSRKIRRIKYFLLAVFVVALPLFARGEIGLGSPAFCKYICPAGTLTGSLPLAAANSPMFASVGWLFSLKVMIAAAAVIACLSAYRFFCKVMCPLGAIYGLFNKIALYGLRVDKNACIECGACANVCKMGVNPARNPEDTECIRCGDCEKTCGAKALQIGFGIQTVVNRKRGISS